MKQHRLSRNIRLCSAVGLALLLALSACSQGTDERGDSGLADGAAGSSGSQDASSGADADAPRDSATDDANYDDDAGEDLHVYEYPDDPVPAEESARTLCNLDRQYFESLRAQTDEGEPVVDEDLRLAVLSMTDNLLLWESMRSHYPEYEEAIADARLIRDEWDKAVLAQENGDSSEAQQAMRAAEEVIVDLPVEALSDGTDCPA